MLHDYTTYLMVGAAIVVVLATRSIGLLFLAPRLRQTFFSGLEVAITGGSSGIGLAVAKLLLHEKGVKRVMLIARNSVALDKARTYLDMEGRVSVCALDVSDPEAVAEKLTTGGLSGVDVLINCAGFSVPAALEDLAVAEIDQMVKVNLLGSVYLTRAIVPLLKKRRRGAIAFCSSQAGQIGLYGFSVYSATKFALRGFAEALKMELDPFNVKVSIIFPADTDTPGLENENKRKPEITRLISATSGVMKPEAVAALLVSGLEEGRFLVPVNFDGWILNLLTVGMAVTGLSVLVELLVWPLLRLVGVAHTLYFSYLVKKHVST